MALDNDGVVIEDFDRFTRDAPDNFGRRAICPAHFSILMRLAGRRRDRLPAGRAL
jgi:hypothetical protein